MSKLCQENNNIISPNKLSEITNNTSQNTENNKCKCNNNNLDSSKNTKDENKKKNNINNDKFNYSPGITFGHMPMLYNNDFYNNSWKGLKLSLNFRPTQLFQLEYMLNIEKNKKLFNNYSANCRTYVPLSSILFPINLILIGNKDSSKALSFQSHLLLGEKDKISIITNNIPKEKKNIIDIHNNLFSINNQNKNVINEKNELNNINNNNNINNSIQIDEKENKDELENTYSIEYSHEFSRGNIGIKCTNLEPNTFNFQISLYKNLFFGMEFFRNPNREEKYHFLKANYGIMLKQTPFNKFGFTFNYFSTLPASIFNFCYQVNNNFKLYLNTIFNRNELMMKLGQDKFSSSISSCYKNDFIEMNTELNNKGVFKFLGSFSCNKYIDVLLNFSYDHFSKNKRKKVKCFGFGLNFKNNSVEDKLEELIEKQQKTYLTSNTYNNNMKLK